jgi:PQQ-dependent dehydrogenase (s-GDH family)
MLTLVSFFLGFLFQAPTPLAHPDIAPGPEKFSMRVVTSGLANPWEMVWGPDGKVWLTERGGKRIVRIDPADGTRKVAVTLPDILQTHAQDGLLGLALHPGLLTTAGPNHVFAALTYDADPGAATVRRLMIRRFTYDPATETLINPADILTGLPAGEDHISGRLVIGQDTKLYLTLGDGGFNQLGLYCQPIRVQELPTTAEIASRDWRHYEGKVLRINLDGSIPADNPTFDGIRSHAFSVGHRNAQGLVVARDGKIYASEHGPSMDDEVNLIEAGKNYGWPYVAGYRDDRFYTYNDWSASKPTPCASLKFTEIVAPESVPQQKETAWNDPAFMPPIRTFFTMPADWDIKSQGFGTIAPSGMDVYSVPTGGIPGWSNSLLVASLTRGVVYRIKLAADGRSITGQSFEYFKRRNRYRDVMVGPDGRTIYAIADAGSQDNPGSVLAFTYEP